MNGQYAKEAAEFVTAIKQLAENPDGLEYLEIYLSHHFGSWLVHADTPKNITAEMKEFAEMK